MKKDIYVVIVTSRIINGNYNISQECYDTQEKAIKFIESKLTKEELDLHNKQLKRNLISWYEYTSKNNYYEIKVLSLA
ncbi:MAG: hypothetical protein IIU93_04770 [Alistipes sp.]|nr:hypothetical protein [Alistipes sp.]